VTAYSAIIPAFNAEPYIAEAIISVRGQTIPPEEIIVVDDGSTDRTAEIIAGLGPDIRLIRQANRGSGAATTAAIEAVTTPLIAGLDSDDIWLPHKMETQLSQLERMSEIAAIFGRVRQFRDDRELINGGPVTDGWGRSTMVIRTRVARPAGPVIDPPPPHASRPLSSDDAACPSRQPHLCPDRRSRWRLHLRGPSGDFASSGKTRRGSELRAWQMSLLLPRNFSASRRFPHLSWAWPNERREQLLIAAAHVDDTRAAEAFRDWLSATDLDAADFAEQRLLVTAANRFPAGRLEVSNRVLRASIPLPRDVANDDLWIESRPSGILPAVPSPAEVAAYGPRPFHVVRVAEPQP
jgi:glycosyltransferase involved in cell wall biosynthesis